MKIVNCLFLILLWLPTFPAFAFHAEINKVTYPLPERQTLPQLYFQISSIDVQLDDLLSDPAYHHTFQLLTEQQQVQFKEHQAVWFFARIHNNSARTLNSVLEYNFPLADKIEIYMIDRQSLDTTLLARTGTDYPFTERSLPYRSYAVNLPLTGLEDVDVYIKVQDAAIVPGNIMLWQAEAFAAHQQNSAMFDGMLQGIMLLLAFYNVLVFYRTHNKLYLYNCGFFLSFALTIAILNGMAFELLWPSYPEINKAILYLSTGAALMCFNLFIRHALQPFLTGLWRWTSHIGTFSAMLLLFSPLYASGEVRLYILFISLTWVLCSSVILALRLSFAGYRQARLFIWTSIFTLFSALLLTTVQAGYLNDVVSWPYILLALVLFSLALTSFNLHSLSPTTDSKNHNFTELLQYHDIFHNAVEGMFTTSLDGHLLNANKALLNILGYSSLDELKRASAGRGMVMFYADPQDRQQMVTQLQAGSNRNFEIRGLRSDSSPFWALMSARLAQPDQHAVAFIHGSVIDITEQKLAHEQLAYLANHDALTSLFNRHYFEQQLQLYISNTQRSAGCLLFIDVDQFKLVNTSCSHSAGDALLKQLSELLKRTLGHNRVLARLDSDEFGILLPGKSANEAFALAYRVLDAMKEFRFIWQDNVFNVSVSIGVSEIMQDDTNADAIIKNAGAACSIAKEKGRNRIQLFDTNDQDTLRHQAEIKWVAQLRHAIEQDQFVLYQQTISPLTSSETGLHYELLLRLQSHDDNLIAPGSFISSAERYGLMPRIDRWVIRHYFRWLQQHPQHMQQLQMCCINLSGSSLIDPTFKDDVQGLFNEFNIPYQRICFEITESVAIVNLQNTLNFISHFRQQGCLFALDDFGSGFSSYSYLKHFPADFVKIDGHFVRDLLDDHYDKAIVKSIHDVARATGMRTVAEYVENNDILAALKLMDIDYVQGYAIARPMPLSTLVSST